MYTISEVKKIKMLLLLLLASLVAEGRGEVSSFIKKKLFYHFVMVYTIQYFGIREKSQTLF